MKAEIDVPLSVFPSALRFVSILVEAAPTAIEIWCWFGGLKVSIKVIDPPTEYYCMVDRDKLASDGIALVYELVAKITKAAESEN